LIKGISLKIINSRVARIGLVFISWLIVREIALRTNGFQEGPILCPLRLLTGYPCPGCGGTRALGAICLGQFEKAWAFNPITFLFCLIVVFWAFQIKPINKLLRKISESLSSLTAPIKVFIIISLYAVAWMAAIARFNSGIL
jgi:hypothetical protein